MTTPNYRIGPPLVFTTREVPVPASDLDDLADVDVTDASAGQVLAKQTDGQWRGQTFAGIDAEPAEWFSGDGPPGVIVGARAGDLYIDRVSGILYQLD